MKSRSHGKDTDENMDKSRSKDGLKAAGKKRLEEFRQKRLQKPGTGKGSVSKSGTEKGLVTKKTESEETCEEQDEIPGTFGSSTLESASNIADEDKGCRDYKSQELFGTFGALLSRSKENKHDDAKHHEHIMEDAVLVDQQEDVSPKHDKEDAYAGELSTGVGDTAEEKISEFLGLNAKLHEEFAAAKQLSDKLILEKEELGLQLVQCRHSKSGLEQKLAQLEVLVQTVSTDKIRLSDELLILKGNLQNAMNDNGKLVAEMETVRSQCLHLDRELKASKQEMLNVQNSCEEKINTLEEQKSNLLQSLESYSQQLFEEKQRHASEVEDLKSLLNNASEEKMEVSSKLLEANQQRNQLQSEIDALKSSSLELKQKVHDLNSEKEQALLEVASHKHWISKAEINQQEIVIKLEEDKQIISVLNAENLELQSKLNGLESEMKIARQCLQETREEKEASKCQIEIFEAENQKLVAEIEELNHQMQQIMKTNSELAIQAEECKNGLQDAYERDKMHLEAYTLIESKLGILNNEKLLLEQQIEDHKKQHTVASISESELKKELEKSAENNRLAMLDLRALETQVKELERDKIDLIEEIKTSHCRSDMLEAGREELMSRTRELLLDLATKGELILKLEEEKRQIISAKEFLNHSLEQTCEQHVNLKMEYSSYKQVHEKVVHERDKFQLELQELTSEWDKSAEERQNTLMEIENLKEEMHESIASGIGELQNFRRGIQEEKEFLNSRLQTIQTAPIASGREEPSRSITAAVEEHGGIKNELWMQEQQQIIKKMETLESGLKVLTLQFEEVSMEKNCVVAENDRLKEDLVIASNDIKSKVNEFIKLETALHSIEGENDLLKLKLEELVQAAPKLEGEKLSLNVALEEVIHQKEKLLSELERSVACCSKVMGEKDTIILEKEKLSKDLLILSNEHKILLNEIAELNNFRQKAMEDRRLLESKVQMLVEENEMAEKLARHKIGESNQQLQQKTEEHAQVLCELKDQKQIAEELLKEKQDTVLNLTTSMFEFEQLVKQRDAEIEKLRDDLRMVSEESKKFATDIADLKVLVGNLQQEKSILEVENVKLEEELKALADKRAELERDFADIGDTNSKLMFDLELSKQNLEELTIKSATDTAALVSELEKLKKRLFDQNSQDVEKVNVFRAHIEALGNTTSCQVAPASGQQNSPSKVPEASGHVLSGVAKLVKKFEAKANTGANISEIDKEESCVANAIKRITYETSKQGGIEHDSGIGLRADLEMLLEKLRSSDEEKMQLNLALRRLEAFAASQHQQLTLLAEENKHVAEQVTEENRILRDEIKCLQETIAKRSLEFGCEKSALEEVLQNVINMAKDVVGDQHAFEPGEDQKAQVMSFMSLIVQRLGEIRQIEEDLVIATKRVAELEHELSESFNVSQVNLQNICQELELSKEENHRLTEFIATSEMESKSVKQTNSELNHQLEILEMENACERNKFETELSIIGEQLDEVANQFASMKLLLQHLEEDKHMQSEFLGCLKEDIFKLVTDLQLLREEYNAMPVKNESEGMENVAVIPSMVTSNYKNLPFACNPETLLVDLLHSIDATLRIDASISSPVNGPNSSLESFLPAVSIIYKEVIDHAASLREQLSSALFKLEQSNLDIQEHVRDYGTLKEEKEQELSELYRRVQVTSVRLLDYQSEVERLSLKSQQLSSEKEKLQLDLVETEQRLATTREKLSLAVNKGKGLVQQRDALKQALAAQSEQSELLKVELQKEREQFNLELQNMTERLQSLSDVNVLRDELAFTKDSAQQSVTAIERLKETILEYQILPDIDADAPSSLVDKVSFFLRDSHEAKQKLAEMKQQMEVSKQLVKSLLLEMENEIGNLDIIEEEDGSASKLIDLLHECGDKVSELRNQNVLLTDELASLHRQVSEHSYLLEEKINLQRRTDAAVELLIQTLHENNFDHPLINDESMLLEDYLSTLVGKYKSAVSELAHIRTEPDTRDMTLRSLREELASKDLELGDYNRKWEEAALTMAYQEDQIQGLLQRSQRQRDDMVVVSHERDSLHSQLSSLTAERDRVQLELTASEQRLTSVREKLSLAIKKGKGLAQQRDDLKHSLLEKSQEVENMNSHLRQYESGLQAALDHSKVLEQEVYSLRDAMALTQKNLNESKEFKQRLELIVNELDGRSSDEPLKKIERLIRMLNQAQNKVSSSETEMSKLKSEVSVLHNQLSEAYIRQGYLESSYKDAEAETASIIRKLEDTLSQREMQIESYKKEIEYLLSSHDEKQQQLTAFQDALFEANSREVSISNELASLMKKVSELSEEKQLLQASKVESWDYLEGAVNKLKTVALELHLASGSSESLESAISLEEVLVVISKALSNFVGYVGQNMATVDLAVKTKSFQKVDALEKLRRTAVDIFTLMASTDIHFLETRKDRSFKNMLENALNSKYGSDVSDSNHLGIKLHGHIENFGKLISWVEFESESFVEEICLIEGFLAKGLEQTTSIIEDMGTVHLEGVTPNVYEVLKAFKHDKDTLHSAIQYAVELVEQIMADNFQKVSPKLHAQYSETADLLKKSRSLANRSGSNDLAMHIDILNKSFTRFLQMQNQIIKDLEEDLGAKTSEISQLQNLINDLRTGSEIQGRRFRAFKENREASLEEVESKYKRLLTDKQRVLENLQQHVAEAEDKIKTIEIKWSLDKSRVSELELQVSKWEMECQLKQQMLVDKDRELDQLQLISINNQREIEIQNQVVNDGKAQLPILYERIESLEKTLRQKQAGLEMMEASRSKAAFRLSATLKLLNELQQHGEGLLTEIQRLQADLDIRDTEISAISQKLNSAEDEVKILQDALSAETFKSEQSLRQLNELFLKVRQQSKHKTMNETGSTMQTTFESVLEALGKHVNFLVMENSALQENAQKAQTALQSLQMDFEAVSIQKRLLQDEVTNRDSRIQRLQTDKIVEVEEMRASPSMSTASNVRSLRKLPIADHVAVEVDIDDNIMDMEEKGHVLKPLGTLKFVPKAGRAVAEILDSLCISGGRLLMRQPMARLGFSLYWIAIHIWIIMMLAVAKY